MTTVFITGGAGFIGSSLAESLLAQGHTVVSFDNFNDFYDPNIKRRNIDRLAGYGASFISIEGDIRDVSALGQAWTDHSPDVMVHLAAMAGVRPSIDHPALYYDVNIQGTLNVFQVCQDRPPNKVIMASSSSVYGNNPTVPFSEAHAVDRPISPYAATKKMNEIMAYNFYHLHGIPICCCRFFTVYGPYQRPEMAIHKFTAMIDQGRAIPMFNFGQCERDYTYIDDIVHGLEQIMGTDYGYDIVNLGESQTITTRELVQLIETALNKTAIITSLPAQTGDVERTFANIDHAKKTYGYQPTTSIHEGIQRFVTWYQAQTAVTP
jgi:UDP-glucuronate 4-epimerase